MNIINKIGTDYYPEVTKKDTIILHYTAGLYPGSEETLKIKDYVNVHYQILKNGNIHNYISPMYWAYHTGSGAKNDRRFIGIEMECWGHLTRKDNALYTWTNRKIPWDNVVRCRPFRGFEYWEKLTNEQIDSLLWLIEYLNDYFDLDYKHRLKVHTHAQYKKTKLDYPPDYPQLINIVSK